MGHYAIAEDAIMHAQPESSPNPPNTFAEVPFKTLDTCHEDIALMLDEMRELAAQLERASTNETLQQKARTIHLFFSGHAIEHHLDEERHVFPALLEAGQPELVGIVRKLQRHHALLEARWAALGPQLYLVARGYAVQCAQLREEMRMFVDLYGHHMTLEDTLVYPLARGLLNATAVCAMNQEMARRRLKADAGESDDDEWA